MMELIGKKKYNGKEIETWYFRRSYLLRNEKGKWVNLSHIGLIYPQELLEKKRFEALNRIPKSITVDGMVAAGRLVTINDQDFDERLKELEGPQGVTITVTKKEVFNESKF